MAPRAQDRAAHIKDAISKIRQIMKGYSYDQARSDIAVWPAFQRYLEIISEASGKLPPEWKRTHGPGIPWKDIAGLGNILRHVYHRTSDDALWSIYENDLDPLEAAIDRMLAAHGSKP